MASVTEMHVGLLGTREIICLRGLLAFVVLVSHCLGWVVLPALSGIQDVSAVALKLLLPFFNGGNAVGIFFVLSGYVLTLSVRRLFKEYQSYQKIIFVFFVQRSFRLLPPAFVVVFVIWLISLKYDLSHGFSLAGKFWTLEDNSYAELFRHVFLFSVSYLHPLWSLQFEYYGALFIPIFVFCFYSCFAGFGGRNKSIFLLLFLLGLLFLGWGASKLGWYAFTWQYCFFLGVWASRLEKPSVIPKFLAPVALLGGLFTLVSIKFFSSWYWMTVFNLLASLPFLLWYACSNGKFKNLFLTNRFFFELGQQSFGLYLVHALVLAVALYLCSKFVSNPGVGFLSAFALILVPLVVLFSYLFSRCFLFKIEVFSIQFGKQLSKLVFAKPGVVA